MVRLAEYVLLISLAFALGWFIALLCVEIMI